MWRCSGGEAANFAKTFTLELYACDFCELCVQVGRPYAIIIMKVVRHFDRGPARAAARKDRLHDIGLRFGVVAPGTFCRDMHTAAKVGECGRPAE